MKREKNKDFDINMIKQSFQICDGIGELTENKLWKLGFKNWDKILQSEMPDSFSRAKWRVLQSELVKFQEVIDKNDFLEFNNLCPSKLIWRSIPELIEKIAFLDIETTGLDRFRNKISTIAVYDGIKCHNFVNGKNLDDFPEFIKKFPAIATYYGKCFDIPFIKNRMGIEMDQIHYDLCFLLRRVGITGGLKSIEKQFNISRGNMADLDGYSAVILWEKYQKKKEEKYLSTLLAYNNEDVINLEYLLYIAYNKLIKKNKTPFKKLKIPAKDISNPFIADNSVIKELKEEMVSYFPWI